MENMPFHKQVPSMSWKHLCIKSHIIQGFLHHFVKFKLGSCLLFNVNYKHIHTNRLKEIHMQKTAHHLIRNRAARQHTRGNSDEWILWDQITLYRKANYASLSPVA